MNTTRIGWRVQLCTGIALASMALAAVRVDILNNLEYGMTVSSELATILAAIGVVALPTAASILGWSRHLRITTTVCVIVTVWAAINAYSAKQGALILQAQSRQQEYEAAEADQKSAREALNRIREVGDAVELGKMQSAASVKRAKDCKKPWLDVCKLAEVDEKLLTDRLSNAKSRDAAKAALATAKQEAKAGPAEASSISTFIARNAGGDASNIARLLDFVMTGFGIAITQLIALLGGQAATLIGNGFVERHTARTAAKAAAKPVAKEKPGRPPTGGTKLPANVIPLDAAKHSVKAWLDRSTATGGEMRGGEALKGYKRYAGHMAKTMTSGGLRAILSDLLGPDAVETRTSGYVVRGVQLKDMKRRPRNADGRRKPRRETRDRGFFCLRNEIKD